MLVCTYISQGRIERFPYHSNFTAIFDGNYKFLPSIDLEKLHRELIKKFEIEGGSGNPRNPLKTAPVISTMIMYMIVVMSTVLHMYILILCVSCLIAAGLV